MTSKQSDTTSLQTQLESDDHCCGDHHHEIEESFDDNEQGCCGSGHGHCHDPQEFEESIELPSDHVLATMYQEHECILELLRNLHQLNISLQPISSSSEASSILSQITTTIEKIIAAEPHHQREERVLFPAIEEKGVFGPPRIMRMEHEQLRKTKHTIHDLVITPFTDNFQTLKQTLDLAIHSLVTSLSQHIQKENEILYPMALRVITDENEWTEMKSACDKIGYCCFDPNKNNNNEDSHSHSCCCHHE